MNLDGCVKLLEDLLVFESLGDLVLVHKELHKDVLYDLPTLYSHIEDAKALKALDDFTEGVRRDLILTLVGQERDCIGCTMDLEPVQLTQH